MDGKRHGRGICVYVDGSKYEGEPAAPPSSTLHKPGMPGVPDPAALKPLSHRHHVLLLAGEWQDNQRHGKGTCLFANGDKYQGDALPLKTQLHTRSRK